jgi:exopolysaccharide production protein ExoZ
MHSSRRLDLLESCRGIAAFGVVIHHIQLLLQEPRYGGVAPFGGALFPGYHGVDFFFVLSGFIITYAHWNDIDHPQAIGRYGWRRFSRVIPAYWAVTTLLLVIYLSFPSLGKPSYHDPVVIVTSYLLLPMPDMPVLGVAWTLRFEAIFYVLFAVLILNRRIGIGVFAVWFVAVAFALPFQLGFPASFFLSELNAQFLMGMMICIMLKRLRPWRPELLAATGVALLVAFYGLEARYAPAFEGNGLAYAVRDTYGHFAYGIAAAVTILGLAQLELSRKVTIPAPLLQLGRASYSLYLIHGFCLSLTATVLFRLGGVTRFGLAPVAVALAASALAGGLLFHAGVERPILRALRGPASPSPRSAVAAARRP